MLLDVGTDRMPRIKVENKRTGRLEATVPLKMVEKVADMDELIECTFADVNDIVACMRSSIVTGTNAVRHAINATVLARLPGETHTARSHDSTNDPHNKARFPQEFLIDAWESGVPQHELKWKKNTIPIITQNLSHKDGLLNGTRVVIKGATDKFMVAHTLDEKEHLIPRINFFLKGYPVRRRMFPLEVRAGYGIWSPLPLRSFILVHKICSQL
eukprot:jgi/Mesvir1/15705/Mv26144-RA.1